MMRAATALGSDSRLHPRQANVRFGALDVAIGPWQRSEFILVSPQKRVGDLL
jgi:hypothetical protein